MFILHQKKGFTLIELMIVVAIIGILVTIAIPNFLKFQAKSKQAEVKSNLGGLYTGLQTFRFEFGSYTTDLQLLGWAPAWRPRYNYGFQTDNPDPSGTLVVLAGVTSNRNSTDQLPVDSSLMVKSDGSTFDSTYLPASTANIATFTIGAVGNVDNDATNDLWMMNQSRDLTNLTDDVSQ
jgi:type IV pilus assembly protein PilA